MGRFWTLFFLLVPVLGVATFVVAAMTGYWMPQNASVEGAWIDHLFYIILAMTGVVFVITQLLLVWCLWKYDGKAEGRGWYSHGHHQLEVGWTLATAILLLFLVFYQDSFGALGFEWGDVLGRTKLPGDDLPTIEVEVVARQFEWRIRYPGPDGTFYTPDDLHTVNDLRLPVNRHVLVQLRAEDVLHSFYLPNLRIKQDAVPGMRIPVPFTPIAEGEYDLVCAELCGWGHYKMKGRLTVQSQADFDAWLKAALAAQEAVQ